MRFAGGMDIERFAPAQDTELVRECYEIFHAVREADDPDLPVMSWRVFEGWLRSGWVDNPRETWLTADADGVAGWYVLELPSRDNRHLAVLDVLVRPSRQRHGLGTALLRHAAGRALADDRTLLAGRFREGAPGEAFARGAGAVCGLADIHRVLDLDTAAAGRRAELRAAAQQAAAGYSLVSWEGLTPEKYLDQVAAINRALADAPHDPNVEASVWDAERVRAAERRIGLQGLRAYTVAAAHERTGELGGFTQVEVSPANPARAFQGLTAVIRAHRGHRLGLFLKLAMLDRLAEAEPQVRQVFTENSETNEHMIAINEALGYRVVGGPLRSWELKAADVVAAQS